MARVKLESNWRFLYIKWRLFRQAVVIQQFYNNIYKLTEKAVGQDA